MKKNRFLAICTAVAVSIGAFAGAANAAPATYQEGAGALLQDNLDQYAKMYDKGVAAYPEATKGVNVTLDASLNESGRALAGMFSPVDLSWFQNAGISMDAAIIDFIEAGKINLLINDYTILSMLFQMDVETMNMLVQIPQLSSTYLKGNYNDIMAEAVAEAPTEIPISPEAYQAIMKAAFAFMKDPIPSEVVTDILDRYISKAIDAFEDGGAVEDTVTIEGVSEDATMVTGAINGVEFYALLQDLLKTAKEDTDIKDILIDYGGEEGEKAYAELLNSIDEQLAKLDETQTSEDDANEYLVNRLWINADNKLIGCQVSASSNSTEAEDEEIFFTFCAPSSEDASAFYLDITDLFTISGSGTTADGLLSGSYGVSMDGEALVNIEVTDYDTLGAEEGNISGNYRISIADSGNEDMAFFASFGLNVALDYSSTEGGSITLSLDSSGSPLATISLSNSMGQNADVEVIDYDAAEPAVDMNDEAGMGEYAAGIDIMSILQAVTDAGVPDDVISGIFGMLGGEPGYADDDAA